jgi:2-methylcitrate dehydratase PrpD
MPETGTYAAQLGRHFSTLDQTTLEPSHFTEMKRLLIDYIGVALGGSATESGRIAGEFAASNGGTAEATIIGLGDKVPAVHAAFANAIAEHSLELDDVDEEALFHYAPPVMSAALAMAERVDADGRELLIAALVGCEMLNRLSRAVNPALRDRGYHTTPTCGVFGAAVAAGYLLHLSPEQMTSALGLAGAQASGLMEMYGPNMQKRFNPGPAARNGVTAAIMASMGFTGADTIFEGERGFATAFAGRFDASKLTAGLGEEIPVDVEYKPYSAARPIHTAIDCALEIRDRDGVRLADIESVVVRRHPDWAHYHVINEPRSYHEAQVSLPYSVAVAFADGQALPAQYSDERIAGDTAVMSVAARVSVVADDALLRGVSCHMTVTTRDGRTFVSAVDYAKGSRQRPLSDDELLDKFRMLAAAKLAPDDMDRVVTALMVAEELPSVREFVGSLHPA